MVIEGSRRSKLADELADVGQASQSIDEKVSKDDAFLLDCLTTLGVKASANGLSNGTTGHDRDTNEKPPRTDESSIAQQSSGSKSEKGCLGLITLAMILRADPGTATGCKVASFVMHSILMEEIEVSKRRLQRSILADNDSSTGMSFRSICCHFRRLCHYPLTSTRFHVGCLFHVLQSHIP